MVKSRRGRTPCGGVALFVLAYGSVLAASALAQVPQDVTYTGRLVDGGGSPLAGPVNLSLALYDADTGGALLYSEQHGGVALDATGGFSVQLGAGSSPSGSFDASLFDEPDRWLEVTVGAEVLAPRQILASVPWALVAEEARELWPDCRAGTTRVGAWCIDELTRSPKTWPNAKRDCWDDGMQLCPLDAILACDDQEPSTSQCTAETDSGVSERWIWCGETNGNDVNAFNGVGARIFANIGNNQPDEIDYAIGSPSYIYYCCAHAPR